MTTLAQIELATERAIVARLVLELLRNVQRHYFREAEFLDAVELALVGVYVFLAQQDRNFLLWPSIIAATILFDWIGA